MFKSKQRAIVTPQSEHLNLVGTLALLWGNDEFESPAIGRNSMVLGMGLHDRGYGYLDTSPVGEMQEDEWIRIARRGFYMEFPDKAADMIVKYHVRRLAGYGKSAERKKLTAEFSRAIDEQQAQHGLSRALYDRLDRITNLCDKISYDFCLDAPATGEAAVFPHNEDDTEVTLQYQVEHGKIHVTPWPFSTPTHQGYLLAYHSDGYPEKLDPVLLPYMLERT